MIFIKTVYESFNTLYELMLILLKCLLVLRLEVSRDVSVCLKVVRCSLLNAFISLM